MTPTDTENKFWASLSAPPTMVNLRRLFLLATRTHFLDPNNYGAYRVALAALKWSEMPEECTLAIKLLHDFDRDTVGNALPAIYVGLGDLSFETQVVGNYAGSSPDNSREITTVAAKNMVQWSTFALQADEATAVAEQILSFFMGLRSKFIEKMGLQVFDIQTLSAPMKIKNGDDEYYRVDVRAAFQYNHVMTLAIESHRLKKISIEIDTAAGSWFTV